VVDHIRRLDADPFIVPAMGSHAGGTAEGQQKILESYGDLSPIYVPSSVRLMPMFSSVCSEG
jgi:hypothetical protein